MRRPLAIAFLLELAACGEAGPPRLDTRPLPPPQLVVVNKCPAQTPDFTALHLHSAVDNYRGTPNLLAGPLKVEESVLLKPGAGSFYVTAVRTKLDTTPIAMTTKTPLELLTGTYELWLLQQSFRLYPPRPSPDLGRPREAGRADLPRRDAAPRDAAPREAAADAPRPDRGRDRSGE